MATPTVKSHYAAIQSFIEERAPIWRSRLKLEHFEIEHVFLDSYYGDDGEEDFKITATTETRWNYQQAKVKWYLPSAIRHELEKLEKTLVHELCHVLLAAEQALLDDELERVSREENVNAADSELIAKLYYERLEQATESVTRALWAACGPAKV